METEINRSTIIQETSGACSRARTGWLTALMAAMVLIVPATLGLAPGAITSIAVPAMGWDAEAPDRTLSFEDRVLYQRRIEQVYWSHRIWPAENPGPKPALAKVLPDSVIRQRVQTYLEKSAALEAVWSRPLTGDQLQAEMNRMARRTKSPDLLRELFAALDDDPFLIAECLARPLLVDRLARNWYARDTRFHGELRQQAEEALAIHSGDVVRMSDLGGEYEPAGGGGGILVNGYLVLEESVVRNNSACFGGGLFVSGGDAVLTRDLIEGNSASFAGGGIGFGSSSVQITNSTMSGNSATYGGGMYAYYCADASCSSNVAITSTTITDNAAGAGGGMYAYDSYAQFEIQNSIVAGNGVYGECVLVSSTSLGHNLSSDNSCGFNQSTDLTNTDPQLGPLADNGGPTKTHALPATSLAVDAGPLTCEAVDQRGVSRPQDGDSSGTAECDIGAFELDE